MKINETIEVSGNDWLEVEVKNIRYEDGINTGRPSWLKIIFSQQDLSNGCDHITAYTNGILMVDEDNVEKLVKKMIGMCIAYKVSTFRWTWDKNSVCKA